MFLVTQEEAAPPLRNLHPSAHHVSRWYQQDDLDLDIDWYQQDDLDIDIDIDIGLLQVTKSVTSFLLSHIGLLSLVVGYCIMGAFIFQVNNDDDDDDDYSD